MHLTTRVLNMRTKIVQNALLFLVTDVAHHKGSPCLSASYTPGRHPKGISYATFSLTPQGILPGSKIEEHCLDSPHR